MHIWSVGGTARKPESSCRYGGAVRREVSERRDSWYRIRVTLNRKHIYCFISPQGKWKIVNMNKTMWPTEPSFQELENLRTLQSWLPVYSRACLEHRKCFCHFQREGGTFAGLKWALCLRKGRGKSLEMPWLVEDKQLLLWLSVPPPLPAPKRLGIGDFHRPQIRGRPRPHAPI